MGDVGCRIPVAGFADDILLFMDRSKQTLPLLMEELAQIGKLSGYTLNLDKTEALLLRGPAKPLWSTIYPSKWQSNSLKYLGVRITKNPVKLYKEKMSPYLQNLELTLHTWTNFALSYLGRANLIKMVEFPRLLYLMHSQSTLPLKMKERSTIFTGHLYGEGRDRGTPLELYNKLN